MCPSTPWNTCAECPATTVAPAWISRERARHYQHKSQCDPHSLLERNLNRQLQYSRIEGRRRKQERRNRREHLRGGAEIILRRGDAAEVRAIGQIESLKHELQAEEVEGVEI